LYGFHLPVGWFCRMVVVFAKNSTKNRNVLFGLVPREGLLGRTAPHF
jgi:hypothetical protein